MLAAFDFGISNTDVAIFSEKESHAVYLLTKHGVSRLDVVTFISHGKKSKKDDVGAVSYTHLTLPTKRIV